MMEDLKMAALSQDRTYGMNCGRQTGDRVTVLHVKLTETALRAIENHQNSKTSRLTIQFNGPQGCIKIPRTDSSDTVQKFDFLYNVGKGNPQGSFECMQQNAPSAGASHLASLGTIQDKITVCATNESYQVTQERMTQAVEETHKRTSSILCPANYNTIRNKCLSNNPVARQSYRDRIIHLLAQRSCKDVPTSSQKRKPEDLINPAVTSKKPRISHLNKSGPPATSSSSDHRDDDGGPAAKGPFLPAGVTSGLPPHRPVYHHHPAPSSSTPFVRHHQRFDQIQCKPEHNFIKPVGPKKPRISHANKSRPAASSSSAAKGPFLPAGVTSGLSPHRPVYHPAPSYSHHHQQPPSPSSNSPSTPEGRGTQELPLEQSSSCRDPSPTRSPLPSDRGLQDLSSTTVTPDYVAKYSPLMSMDQRQTYKDDFNAEYDKYCVLHARVESIGRRCTQLVSQCRKLTPGTKEYQRVHEEVKQNSPKFHEAMQRYEYLHNKLAHIKRLIGDFDQRRAQLWAWTKDLDHFSMVLPKAPLEF